MIVKNFTVAYNCAIAGSSGVAAIKMDSIAHIVVNTRMIKRYRALNIKSVAIAAMNAHSAKVFTTSGHEGKTYVITGPEALTFHQVAEKLSSVLGRNIQYVDVPLSTAADGMRKSGMPEWDIRAVTELLDYFASGAAATVTDTIPRLLGRPAISFEQFVKDQRAAFLA